MLQVSQLVPMLSRSRIGPASALLPLRDRSCPLPSIAWRRGHLIGPAGAATALHRGLDEYEKLYPAVGPAESAEKCQQTAVSFPYSYPILFSGIVALIYLCV